MRWTIFNRRRDLETVTQPLLDDQDSAASQTPVGSGGLPDWMDELPLGYGRLSLPEPHRPRPSEGASPDIESGLAAIVVPETAVSEVDARLSPRSETVTRTQWLPASSVIGVCIGGFVGATFGVQFADGFAEASHGLIGGTGYKTPSPPTWPYLVYPPIFFLSTALAGRAIARFGLASSRAAEHGRPLSLLASLRASDMHLGDACAIGLGAAFGGWMGLEYAFLHGGGWRYNVFPPVMTAIQPFSALALARWFGTVYQGR